MRQHYDPSAAGREATANKPLQTHGVIGAKVVASTKAVGSGWLARDANAIADRDTQFGQREERPITRLRRWWHGADLRGASFLGANLQNAIVTDARTEGTNFDAAIMPDGKRGDFRERRSVEMIDRVVPKANRQKSKFQLELSRRWSGSVQYEGVVGPKRPQIGCRAHETERNHPKLRAKMTVATRRQQIQRKNRCCSRCANRQLEAAGGRQRHQTR